MPHLWVIKAKEVWGEGECGVMGSVGEGCGEGVWGRGSVRRGECGGEGGVGSVVRGVWGKGECGARGEGGVRGSVW